MLGQCSSKGPISSAQPKTAAPKTTSASHPTRLLPTHAVLILTSTEKFTFLEHTSSSGKPNTTGACLRKTRPGQSAKPIFSEGGGALERGMPSVGVSMGVVFVHYSHFSNHSRLVWTPSLKAWMCFGSLIFIGRVCRRYFWFLRRFMVLHRTSKFLRNHHML